MKPKAVDINEFPELSLAYFREGPVGKPHGLDGEGTGSPEVAAQGLDCSNGWTCCRRSHSSRDPAWGLGQGWVSVMGRMGQR